MMTALCILLLDVLSLDVLSLDVLLIDVYCQMQLLCCHRFFSYPYEQKTCVESPSKCAYHCW